ncbi:carbon-nitrogen hydrolase family protein [Campylobacter helveticus]|uniref:carbon-nitrogen hydrolase family protein n=1 Tax=Campylobacter helveticus TaxID=28898 RepID=UPI0022EB54AD|nr:carbon-nitrogen hydrolase family protein [Campylobacter helveticus]
MSKVKLASIQFSPAAYERENNIEKAVFLVRKALEDGAKIVVLPELFDSGYCIEDKDTSFAIDLNDIKNPVLAPLTELAKIYNSYIIANSIEKSKNKLYDTAYILSKKGIVGKYRKIYLYDNEKKRFSRGKKYPIFELKFKDFKVKLGLGICYEIGFSEGARFLALQGAQILVYPAAFGKARAYVWDLASRARALESGCFVVAANRCGQEFSKAKDKNVKFAGKTKIINPKGEIIQELGEYEGMSCVELELDEVKAQRENLTYLKDLNLKLCQKMYKALKD